MERGSERPSTLSGESPAAPARLEPRRAPLSSEKLLQGARMVEIVHNGEVYRLQATRLGKLILTK